jgi:hypothetical protein
MTNQKRFIVTRLPLNKTKRGAPPKPFLPGNPGGPGRPKGAKDKFSRHIQQALLDAVEYVGEEIVAVKAEELKRAFDLDTPRGIAAYLRWIARDYPQVACAMLCRMMPAQQQTDVKVEHRFQTMEEIANRLRELGLEPRRIYPLLTDEKKSNGDDH